MVALSNDVHMSTPKKSDPPEGQGVLSNLPRTRPQRSSPRRAAARKASAASAAPARSNGRATAGSRNAATGAARQPSVAHSANASKRPRSAPKQTAGAPAEGERVPRQGFECEGERANGPVQPPGGAELVAGAAEIIGELAKAGFSTGERLLKDVLSRLPLS
jgi:hypothetical protein